MTRHRLTHRIGTALLASLTTLLIPLAAGATGGPATWNDRVQESEALIVAGDYTAALAATEPLLEEMGSRITEVGEKADSALGTVVSLHALALAGVGRQEDAEFHWYLAQSLKPALAQASLASYGVAGERLEPHRFAEGEKCRLADPDQPIPASEWAGDRATKIKPPKRVKSSHPQYTPAARQMGYEGKVVVRAVVDEQGRIVAPCVLYSDATTFTYMVVRALRDWRFRPARRGGEPVKVEYNVTIDFTLDHDHPH
jgi:TonB family protein